MNLRTETLLQMISNSNPLQGQYIARMRKKTASMIDEALLDYLVFFWEYRGMTIQDIADAYLRFVLEAMAEQIYFRKYHQYRNRSYNSICTDTYHSPEYMESYLAALSISDCLWENHIVVRNWYKQRLMKIENCKQFEEIGCGSGVNLIPAFNRFPDVKCTAVDLSEKASEICHSFLAWCYEKGIIESDNFEVICKDAFEWTPEFVPDVFCMFEVLEHVPNPKELLNRIKKIIDEHTTVFISTVINSPMPDHIYLFRNQSEVRKMIETAGFIVIDYCCAPANGLSVEMAEKAQSPITIVFELKKGTNHVIS